MISGHQEYGGRSYSAHPIELIGELQQELLDVASWASILWDRLQRMKHAASGAIDE